MADKKDFSLHDQIKKRKTQEILRGIEAQKVIRATGTHPSVEGEPAIPASPLTSLSTGSQSQQPTSSRSGDPRRTTQVAALPSAARQTHQIKVISSWAGTPHMTLSRRQRQRLIAVIATVLIMSICGVVALTAANLPPQANMPTYAALPTANAEQVLSYLKDVGLHLANVTRLNAPDDPWHAQEQINFVATIGTASGHFTLLTYYTHAAQNKDYGTLMLDPRYKSWSFVERANVLLLIPTKAPASLTTALASHLTSLLEAPYYTYLPTPTSTPK